MAEKRLIDANALKVKAFPDPDSGEGFVYVQDIDEAPTVDAVEVVRCKDCIRWYEQEGVCLKIYSDGAVSAYAWQSRNPDDFCSYGERRTDG